MDAKHRQAAQETRLRQKGVFCSPCGRPTNAWDAWRVEGGHWVCPVCWKRNNPKQ